MNKRAWIVFTLVVALSFGLLLWQKNQTQGQNSSSKELAYVSQLDGTKLIARDDIIRAKEKTLKRQLSQDEKDGVIDDVYLGKKDAKVIVIEYEDFACSHCQAISRYTEKIQNDYRDKVLFIRREYSLNYPNSKATLSAAEVAKKLGGNDAYWKMNGKLFQNQMWVGYAVSSSERQTTLDKYAKESGLDVKKFNELLETTETNGVQEKIDRDKKLGDKAGVTGTPTWLVNGKKVSSSTDANIRQAIKQALEKAAK